MLHKLINHSPDLKRLRDEGFELQVKGTLLLVSSVPYLNSERKIKYGTLVSDLTIAGNKAGSPSSHVVYFIGEHPCNKDGSIISAIQHSSVNKVLADGIVVNHAFSNKPNTGYTDYYHKMATYVSIISDPVASIDPSITAKTFKLIEFEDTDSVFNYPDTNSSRAEINVISDKLKALKVGIIGLGGTGSYILDLVAKTPVEEIHLFDGDKFVLHNAFRAPGAPTSKELELTPQKVEYFKKIYSRMHRNIYSHNDYISSSNLSQLENLDFIFICLDKGIIKREIIVKLEELNVLFIDVGMGVELADNNSLTGILRVTSSTENMREHTKVNGKISFADGNEQDEYSQNIQIAELNSLNAALAVIKWKKMYGFYSDYEKEHHMLYTINTNSINSSDNEI